MNLDQAELAEHARTYLSIDDFESIQTTPVTGGGSGRKFHRVHLRPLGQTFIVMQYDLDRPDNQRFVPVTRYLEEQLNVAVPKLCGFDEERRMVWLQDLGEIDLWSQRLQPWPLIAPLYRKTLDEVWKIHAVPESEISCELEPPFSAGLYRWEQEYFYEHFLSHQSRLKPTQVEALFESKDWKELAEELGALPRFLVHRDFQSRNVMVYRGEVHLIDYQGLRWGRPEYDLASILLDPYVQFGTDHRKELLEYYHRHHCDDSWEDFRSLYWKCAAQRLMQALGAYGNLGRNLGKTEFLKSIPIALRRLRFVLKEGGLLPDLQDALQEDKLTRH
ncbi:MAG: aminoglycoside/choline kinase family phosphotransferase [Verrucomicrobiales bacterium]|jgi:aminoglycoside/choline kinase family phosphotransferase